MQKLGTLVLLSVLPFIGVALASAAEIPSTSIASGQREWMPSKGDQSSTDALVDIGTIRQVDDALEVFIRWPYLPESYGPEPGEKNHVICQADSALSFAVETGFFSSDGQYHIEETRDPATQRETAEQQAAQLAKYSNGISSYGSDPRSLVCWAAARKCDGQAFTWPAPPNTTPLEYSDAARKMNSDYNKAFVPSCTLE